MDEHTYLKKIHDEAKKANEIKYRQVSKKKLIRTAEKKFKTSMIGSLAKFEKYFGHIWGHGQDIEDLTDEQIKYRKVWEVVRTEILNNGNNQLRGMTDEIAQYTMTWDRYHTEFIVRKEQPGDN